MTVREGERGSVSDSSVDTLVDIDTPVRTAVDSLVRTLWRSSRFHCDLAWGAPLDTPMEMPMDTHFLMLIRVATK